MQELTKLLLLEQACFSDALEPTMCRLTRSWTSTYEQTDRQIWARRFRQAGRQGDIVGASGSWPQGNGGTSRNRVKLSLLESPLCPGGVVVDHDLREFGAVCILLDLGGLGTPKREISLTVGFTSARSVGDRSRGICLHIPCTAQIRAPEPFEYAIGCTLP